MKQPFRNLNGILILDKPIGLSSNQALQKVKKLFQAKKAGHTGSLDVLATGVLPICFGEATKFSQFLLEADKVYQVTGKLGERTTTCDSEGKIIEKKSTEHVTKEKISNVIKHFLGETLQTPSMYSALKHHGKPLYELARQGIEVERVPRKIFISQIEFIAYHDDKLTLEVHCSKGTYIRNLIDDVGQALNSGAYVTALRRLKAGPFDASQMVTIDTLQNYFEQNGLEAMDEFLLPIDSMLQHLSKIILDEKQLQSLRYGQTVLLSSEKEGVVKLYDARENFVGVGEISLDGVLRGCRLIIETQ